MCSRYDTGPGFAGVLADVGLLVPLEDAYKKNGWDIYGWAKERATYGGTVSESRRSSTR